MSTAKDTRTILERLPEILAAHRKWLRYEVGGARADMRGADLVCANLRDANLRDADLVCANLRDANLRDADLVCANLRDANLRDAEPVGANLRGANLGGADMRGANLRGADMRGANLRGADMRGANLRGADMRGAHMVGANLRDAAGCVHLTETDHGYVVFATCRKEQVRIIAGCRDFSVAEARAHWGSNGYHTPLSGRRVVAVLDWLEREIKDGFDLSGGDVK